MVFQKWLSDYSLFRSTHNQPDTDAHHQAARHSVHDHYITALLQQGSQGAAAGGVKQHADQLKTQDDPDEDGSLWMQRLAGINKGR